MALDTARIKEIFKSGQYTLQKKVFMNRTLSSGGYEAGWEDISKYVIESGDLKLDFGDNAFLGEYSIDGTTIKLDNSTRKFSRENSPDSLFYGYKTRYKTRFKIEVYYQFFVTGFVDTNLPQRTVESSELAYRWFGILYTDIKAVSLNEIEFSIAPLIKVLQNYPAKGIDETGTDTETLVTRLLAKKAEGQSIFDQYFEGYNINPNSLPTTTIATPIIDEKDTVYDKLTDYSIYDDFFLYVDQDGYLVWDKKTNNASEVFKFFGGNAPITNADYNTNISEILSETEKISNYWSRIVIKCDTGAEVVASTPWASGDGSVVDIYGERTKDFEFKELTSNEAQTIADNLKTIYQSVKLEYEIKTRFLGMLNLKDLVSIDYKNISTKSNLYPIFPVANNNFLDVQGVANNYCSTPYSVNNSFPTVDNTAGFTIEAKIFRKSKDTMTICSKLSLEYSFYIANTNKLGIRYRISAGAVLLKLSTVAISDNLLYRPFFAKVKYQRTDSDVYIDFHTSIDGINWDKLGTTVTVSATDIYTTSGPLLIGCRTDSSEPFRGGIYYVKIYDKNDVLVTNFNANDFIYSYNGVTATASTGEIWTLNSTSQIIGARIANKLENYSQGKNQGIWDKSSWDNCVWANNQTGFYLDGIKCFVVALSHDLNSFTSTITLREV